MRELSAGAGVIMITVGCVPLEMDEAKLRRTTHWKHHELPNVCSRNVRSASVYSIFTLLSRLAMEKYPPRYYRKASSTQDELRRRRIQIV